MKPSFCSSNSAAQVRQVCGSLIAELQFNWWKMTLIAGAGNAGRSRLPASSLQDAAPGVARSKLIQEDASVSSLYV